MRFPARHSEQKLVRVELEIYGRRQGPRHDVVAAAAAVRGILGVSPISGQPVEWSVSWPPRTTHQQTRTP